MHETRTQRTTSTKPAGDLYREVDQEMRSVREMISEELTGDDPLISTLCRHVAKYQGKMLRPAILLLSGKACGTVTDKHVTHAAVIELLHLATLIHDAVLDSADLRRQSPTANQLWGNETSVLLGDFLISKAFDLCNRFYIEQAANELSQSAKTICQGELLQCMSRHDWDMTESRYQQIIEMKTARLYQLCGGLGAILSDAPESTRQALEEYGRLLGCSFQITDDLLDILGDQQTTGKTLGTDLRQEKPTLPLIHFCRVADAASRQTLFDLLERQQEDSRYELRRLLDRFGSLEYAWNRAQSLIEQARESLQSLKASPARESLAQIADFVIKRTW